MIEYILFPLNNFAWIISNILSVVAAVAGYLFVIIVVFGAVGLILLAAVGWTGDRIYYHIKGRMK